jgi:hypothetical protein
MRIRDIMADAMGLAFIVALAFAALGFYADASGFGWYWPNLGGYHFEMGAVQ